MADVCDHGSLARQCELCQRDAEIAELRARAEKAEADAAEWKAASAMNGANMAKYQTRAIVAEERLAKAEARAERLAAECRAWRHAMRLFDGTGYAEALGVVQETIAFREAVDAAGDLKEKP